ncbi:MAG TPA: MBL fold metallo-hydrolase, partial [Kofleriaceae bacterium]|nr:MBL fold metallo-hydrolase [Kofleriaceae bacterium]
MADRSSHRAGLRRERTHASPQFHDGRFRNPGGLGVGLRKGTGWQVAREYLHGSDRRVPVAPLPSVDPRAGWARPPATGLRATWLGHSTVLLEVDGARVLTDPVWSERASPLRVAGPRRFQPVPVAISELPPLDAIVLSHDHYDHLDRAAIVELARAGTPIVTSLGVGARLEAWGIPGEQVLELDWWEQVDVAGRELRLTAAPSQHFSGRSLGDRNQTLWSSFVIAGPRHRVFFSGDTGLTPVYGEVATRLGPFDLVMLEVGAFHPAWGDIHLGPDRALDALELLGGGRFLPIHWGTFNLGLHDWDQPAERLLEVAPARDVELVMPRLGEVVEPAHAAPPRPWWRAVELVM